MRKIFAFGCLLLLIATGCKKKDADLKVQVIPKKITILNITDYSCKDLTKSTPEASLTGPVLEFYELVLQWMNLNRNFKVITFRVILQSPALKGGYYDQTLDLGEIASIQYIGNYVSCLWCTMFKARRATAADASSGFAVDEIVPTEVILKQDYPFTYGSYTGATCQVKFGNLNFDPTITVDTLVSGYLIIQGLSESCLTTDTTASGCTGTDITNVYITIPIQALYQPSPIPKTQN